MRPAPKLTEIPRYPIAAGISLLAIVVTAAWWMDKDISPMLETAMIRRGELWRLVTSILPHGGILHLVFNIYWVWVFGTLLEELFGPIRTAGLILLFAAAPNALEFAFLTGAIGLSGVGYGFFGLLWILSTRDKRFYDAVDPATVQVFVVWFFICIVMTITNIMPVANIAHGGGALLGVLTGFAIARPNRRFLAIAGIAVVVLFSLAAATIWRPVLNLSGRQGYEEGRWGYEALVAQKNREAVRWFRDAIEYQPKRSEYWYDMAIAYDRLNDKPSAIRAYRKAADLGSAPAQSHLGEMYLDKDDAQALFWLRKAAAQNNAFALNSVAWTYATSTNPAIRNPKAALECALKAVQLTMESPDPAFLDTLAEAYYINGRSEEAVKTEEQAIAIASPEDQGAFKARLEKYRRSVH